MAIKADWTPFWVDENSFTATFPRAWTSCKGFERGDFAEIAADEDIATGADAALENGTRTRIQTGGEVYRGNRNQTQ